jgi:hypothetical protein
LGEIEVLPGDFAHITDLLKIHEGDFVLLGDTTNAETLESWKAGKR